MKLPFIKQVKETIQRRFGYIASDWQTPPDRDAKGFLSAYGEIYSLFGIANRIATACGEVKWRLYKGSERSERNQVADHPILRLLDYANEFQTGQEIIELTQLHIDLTGKAYWYLPRNGLGVPAEVWIIPPHLIQPIKSQRDFISGYLAQVGTEKIPFTKEEIIWFLMPDPLNPYGGVGFAQASAMDLDTAIYQGKWNRNFFYNSARPDGALETDKNLSDEQFKSLQEEWSSKHRGLSKAHKIAVLEGGLKYKQIQISQKDMDFYAGSKQSRENLMFAAGMPLSVMGIVENVNRANAEAGDYTFARWLIKPRLVRIKNKLNERLIPMFPLAKGVELDFDEVVPETVEQKRMLAESGMRNATLLIDEARKLLGLDPLPNGVGQQLLVPLNLIPTPISGKKLISEEQPKSKGFTPEQKKERWNIYAQKTERQEQALKRVFDSVFDEQKNDTVEYYKDTGKLPDSLDDEKTAKRFEPAIQMVYESSFEDAVNTVKQLDEWAREWILTRSLTLAKSINITTLEALRHQLSLGIEAGESIQHLTKRIEGYFENNARMRAERIARTEVIAASNEGALHRYEIEGIEKSEVYPAPDACDICLDAKGEYPTQEAHGIIPIHPNCRCTVLPVV